MKIPRRLQDLNMECALVLLLSVLMADAGSLPDMQRRQKEGATAPQIQPEPIRKGGKSLPGEEAQSIPVLRRAAQKGDASAQTRLGTAYCCWAFR